MIPQAEEHLTVLVPCYNEERNIGATVKAIVDAKLPIPMTILVIDDRSTDGTWEVMQDLARRYPITLRRNPENYGLGRTITSCYRDVPEHHWISALPGDNEFDPRSLHGFLNLRHEHDVVLGYIQNAVVRPFERRVASRAFRWINAALYGLPYRYFNGLKLYRCWAFRGIEVHSSGHAYVPELLAKAVLRTPDLRVGEAPFVLRGRAAGVSSAFARQGVQRAVGELRKGYRSVVTYREQVLRASLRSEGD